MLKTPATELFGIKHPVLLAGMNVAAGPRLAAAVTNAGGMGVIGTSYQQSCAVRERAHTQQLSWLKLSACKAIRVERHEASTVSATLR